MGIHQEVKQELGKLTKDEQVINLALAALEGEDAVERALAGENVEIPDKTADNGEQVPPVYLQDITVSGFRGIGPEATLEIPPGPGLTVVVGRNGSGKSSFAEGLEVLLTGESYRWKDKTAVWRKGWRNLHQSGSSKISAQFQVEGKNSPTVIERTWSQNSKPEDGESSGLDGIGWQESLDLYRPILSYKELGIIEDRPSSLHDTLSKVLGIGVIDLGIDTLADARSSREALKKQLDKELKGKILPQFEQIEDPRAVEVVGALKKQNWDLDTIKRLQSAPSTHHQDLQNIINMKVPNQEQVIEIAEEMNNAYTDWSNLSGTEAEQAENLMRILNLALKHYDTHENKRCPVCRESILDGSWRTNVEEQIERLKEISQNYRNAKSNLEKVIRKVEYLVEPRLPDTKTIEICSLISIWKKWSSLPDDKGKIDEHLRTLYSSVESEANKIIEQACQLYSDKEEKWLAAISILSPWISKACQVRSKQKEIDYIRKTERYLKEVYEIIREFRWAPIEEQAKEIWKELRLESNVDLLSVQLTGSRTRRGVALGVEVDNNKAEALSVGSQGEINSFALSIFFPRVMLPASPFRFLVIDDPVQSMDPARVDGLSRLFAKIAEDRRLIVFTHDARLTQSLRVLNLEYNSLEVTRSLKSVVRVEPKHDPVLQYFNDASEVMSESLPHEVDRRVIPGFCRHGLEAACVEAVWRRRLDRGESHEKINKELSKAIKLNQKASLALFDNTKQGSDVFNEISSKWNGRLANAYRHTDEGTHGKYSGSLNNLIKDSRELAKELRYYDI